MNTAVALSGGVDSSVAAHLVLSGGDTERVTGVTLGLWGGERESNSCSTADTSAAQMVAEHLGIPHKGIDWTEQFNTEVVEDFIAAASVGVTKNPCITCNKVFKAEKLFAWARHNGYDRVVTGHYARVVPTVWGKRIGRGVDASKDQSYVLCGFEPEHINMLSLPLGALTKNEVRNLAENVGLFTADKKDSMGLCFSPRKVLATAALGDVTIVDAATSNTVGFVPVGVAAVGQRRGLGVSGATEPKYVVEITSDAVVVGGKAALLTDSTPLAFWRWVGGTPPFGSRLRFQTTAHGTPRKGALDDSGDVPVVRWKDAESKVTPGQVVVAYASVPHEGEAVEVVVGWGEAN